MGSLADKNAKAAITARSKAKGLNPTKAAVNATLARNKAHTAEVKARAPKVVAPPEAPTTNPTPAVPAPAAAKVDKYAAYRGGAPLAERRKENAAIASRAKAKGLKPTKANVDATYKRNRFRVNHPKPKG